MYATEVSYSEYLAYTTEETEKLQVMNLANELDSNVEMAIKRLVQEKQQE